MRRYLIGPIPASYAEQYLRAARDRLDCLTFGWSGTDLELRPDDNYESLVARLPPRWRPEFLVLFLSYSTLPEGLWNAKIPIVGMAGDWNLLWHLYRHRLPLCDVVLTDTVGVELLAREGHTHARPANLYGAEQGLLEGAWPDRARDIDILFVGNFNPAVQRERAYYLARLAMLADRWNVVLRTSVPPAEYRELLGRSRIVFNRSVRGEANLRAFESAAAGALLFQEAGNREVPAFFTDRRECVYYDESNLELLLEHYLVHEDQRRQLADSALRRVEGCDFDGLWRQALQRLDREWPALETRSRSRPNFDTLAGRVWQAAASTPRLDPSLLPDLARVPDSTALQQAIGGVLVMIHHREQPANVTLLASAADHFRRAANGPLAHPIALLNHAEILVTLGRQPEAIREATRLLVLLDDPPALEPTWPDAIHVPAAWDHFRVEWEAAAWGNAGEPALEAASKLRLVRWRAHSLLAELTGKLAHYEAAVSARPDLATTQGALGRALGRAGRPADAVPHLRAAVVENPLDLAAARALAQALADTGNVAALAELSCSRDLLHRAASQVIPAEIWFAAARCADPPENEPPT